MSAATLHLLLPFALPACVNFLTAWPNLASSSSALGKLLRRATIVERTHNKGFQRTLPHERWLAHQFNVVNDNDRINQSYRKQSSFSFSDNAPLAPYMLIADGGTPDQNVWACIQPVHIQIAHDHLVLANPADLDFCYDEATALLETAQPLIEAFGLTLMTPTPWRWYASGEALGELSSASPLSASGRNIEIWLPHNTKTGARSHLWMKLQNEVQMAWFDHPVNRAREVRGACAVNSIWLYAPGRFKPVACPFTRVLSNATATRGLGLAAQASVGQPPATFEDDTDAMHFDRTLIELDTLIKPSMQLSSTALSLAFAALERDWFVPALQALQNGGLSSLSLTLCGDTDLITLAATRADLRKFWRRRTFVELTKLEHC